MSEHDEQKLHLDISRLGQHYGMQGIILIYYDEEFNICCDAGGKNPAWRKFAGAVASDLQDTVTELSKKHRTEDLHA